MLQLHIDALDTIYQEISRFTANTSRVTNRLAAAQHHLLSAIEELAVAQHYIDRGAQLSSKTLREQSERE